MSLCWYFPEYDPSRRSRNPTTAEHFSSDSIPDMAAAVVRESVQNSLDAARRIRGSKARVRFTVQRSSPFGPTELSRYFSDLWPHLRSAAAGLSRPPDSSSPFDFLAIEDFGTSGLEGDPDADFIGAGKNDLFHFWRGEGVTAKGKGEGGSWGVGKAAFARAGRANIFLFLTVRESDRRCLAGGTTVLRQHDVEGKLYEPDGWMMDRDSIGDQPRRIRPIEDPQVLENLRSDFSLIRGSDEPGLSIVIPWLRPEVTSELILEALIREYYLALLSGALQAEVCDGVHTRKISAESLESHAELLEDQAHSVRLAKFSLDAGRNAELTLSLEPHGAVKWAEVAISAEDKRLILERLDRGLPAEVRVQFPIRFADGEMKPRTGVFSCFLLKNQLQKPCQPVFEREGLIIKSAGRRNLRGHNALVRISRGPLADLLRDAENPSHTDWSSRSGNFQDRYRYGPSVLTFVKESAAQLVRLLEHREEVEDVISLSDFFPRVERAGKHVEGDEENEDSRHVVVDPSPPSREGESFVANRRGSEIRVTGRASVEAYGSAIMVQFAYDRASGSPLRKWRPADFSFTVGSARCGNVEDLEIVETRDNSVLVRITGPRPSLRVEGFDVRRDVLVRWTKERLGK